MKKVLSMAAFPDSQWSYVVLLCAMLNHFIIFGIGMSFSVFFKVLMDNFQSSRATTAWFNSIQSGVFYLSGPLVSLLLKRYNWRTLIISGALLNGFGLSFSFFANSIYFLYISIGILVGLGFGLVHVSAVVAVGAYFTKTNQRSFAQGLSLTGGSFGTLIMPVLTYKLIVKYGFRGAFLILGALMFQTMVFGCLILPFKESTQGPRAPKPPARKKFVWTMPKDNRNENIGEISADRVGKVVENDALLGKEEGYTKVEGTAGNEPKVTGEKEMLNLSHRRLTFDPVEGTEETAEELEIKNKDEVVMLKQSDLIRNPKCLLFILMSAAWTSSIFIVMHLLFDFLLVDRHIRPPINAAWIFSIIMISAMAGNVFAAILSIFVNPEKAGQSSQKANTTFQKIATAPFAKSWIFNFCTLLHGLLATPLFLSSARYELLCLVAVSFGFPYGIKMALGPTICVDLFGVKNLPFIYGYTMLASGTGILISPPLGGFLVDLTKNYVVTFWLSAGLSGISCILFTILLVMELKKLSQKASAIPHKLQHVYKEKHSKDTVDDLLLPHSTPIVSLKMSGTNGKENEEVIA